MLGVDPGAGIDEIRAAYRARARDLHPDRRGEHDRAAASEMAVLNAAWATLRDPATRGAYDRSLTGSGPAPTSPHATSRRHASEPPPVYEPGPGCLTAVAGMGPWIAVLVVLAVIFVFTAYAGNDGEGGSEESPPADSEAPMTRVRDLRGSCIGLANGATIVVDCFTVPNEGVIVAQASVGAECPEGTVEWLIRQQQVLACTRPGTEAREP